MSQTLSHATFSATRLIVIGSIMVIAGCRTGVDVTIPDAAPPSWLDRAGGKWLVQINPSWSTLPPAAANGPTGRAQAQAELASDEGEIVTTDLVSLDMTGVAMWAKNGVPILSRTLDPDDPSQDAFRFLIDRNRSGAARNGKYRVELRTATPDTRPWGSEEWVLTAFRLVGSGWHAIAEKDVTIVHQFHLAGSEMKNPPFSISVAGEGSKQGTDIEPPPGTHLRVQVRRAKTGGPPEESEPATTGFVAMPPTDTWIWVIVRDRSGTTDEGTGTGRPFLKCWIAVGDGAPSLVVGHEGRWAAPGGARGHYVKTGIYYPRPASWSSPLESQREILSKGLYVFRAEDVPEATPEAMLAVLRVATRSR